MTRSIGPRLIWQWWSSPFTVSVSVSVTVVYITLLLCSSLRVGLQTGHSLVPSLPDTAVQEAAPLNSLQKLSPNRDGLGGDRGRSWGEGDKALILETSTPNLVASSMRWGVGVGRSRRPWSRGRDLGHRLLPEPPPGGSYGRGRGVGHQSTLEKILPGFLGEDMEELQWVGDSERRGSSLLTL